MRTLLQQVLRTCELILVLSKWVITVDTDANNELITDGGFVQPLTAVEIEALKKSGAKATVRPGLQAQGYEWPLNVASLDHIQDIIKAQIEQHANYELKTEYSKDKYIKRKEAK